MSMLCDLCGGGLHFRSEEETKSLRKEYNETQDRKRKQEIQIELLSGRVKACHNQKFQTALMHLNHSEPLLQLFDNYFKEYPNIFDKYNALQKFWPRMRGSLTDYVPPDLTLPNNFPTLLIKANKFDFLIDFLRFLYLLDRTLAPLLVVNHKQEPERKQFTYLYMGASHLKMTLNKEKYDYINTVGLVIYDLGEVSVNYNYGNWGDEVLSYLKGRKKSTWILQTKSFDLCQETNLSPKLKEWLNELPCLELSEIKQEPIELKNSIPKKPKENFIFLEPKYIQTTQRKQDE